MTKILVADDHRVLREGLKRIIEQSKDMQVVAEAADGAEVLTHLKKISVQVVLLDISMPGASGIDILKQIKTKYPKLAVLMLSQHSEDQYAIRAMRAGASGYLTKESASTELLAAIRKVAVGGKYVNESLAEKMASALGNSGEKPLHESLSDREYEILRMLSASKTVTEIAEELSLSVKTISTYRARLLEKMNMTKTSELMLYGIQNGLTHSEKPARTRRSRS